jgi:hypothetical protein
VNGDATICHMVPCAQKIPASVGGYAGPGTHAFVNELAGMRADGQTRCLSGRELPSPELMGRTRFSDEVWIGSKRRPAYSPTLLAIRLLGRELLSR